MTIRLQRRLRVLISILATASASAAFSPALAEKPLKGKHACESASEVEGWSVTASLAPADSGSLLVRKWEASRNFSAQFGLRVTYDTSDRPDPALNIWHNYKSGAFAMQLPDRTSFSVPLSANYAVTQANVPPDVISYLRSQPALIEHTHSGNKWNRYRTEGLPEAIAAAEAQLALITQQQADKACAVHKGWRRFLE